MVPGPYLVGIAGGSGSGKSALTAALGAALVPLGVAHVCMDAYYRDRGDLSPRDRERLNFDVPDAFDMERLVEDLRSLRRGRSVEPPRYCFVTHRRIGRGPAVTPADVILVEGILLLHDARIRDLLDLRIYLDAPGAVRLDRRIARDVRERGRTAESVHAQYRASTLPAHREHVEPSRAWADVVLVNGGRLEPVAEVAATLIRTHRERRSGVAWMRPA